MEPDTPGASCIIQFIKQLSQPWKESGFNTDGIGIAFEIFLVQIVAELDHEFGEANAEQTHRAI